MRRKTRIDRDERRLRSLVVSPHTIASVLAQDSRFGVFAGGVPEGSVVVSSHYDDDASLFVVTLTHPSFTPVPRGSLIPFLVPELRYLPDTLVET
jgi:hypothetical protein